MRRIAPLAALALLLTAIAALPQDVGEKVDKIMNRVEDTNGASLVDDIRELEQLGPAALADVRKCLSRPNAFVRIAAAKYLYGNEMKDEAVEALTKTVSGKDARGKRAAADYLASLVGTDTALSAKQRREIADGLISRARETDDEMARIHLWRAVWHLTETIQPKRELRDLFSKAASKEIKHELVLALAEMDSFLQGTDVLKEVAKEAGDRGRLARSYLKIKALQDDLNRALLKSAGGGNKRDYALLDELIDSLHEHYYDAAKIDDAKLLEAAARGLSSSLDPYTSYYDEKMIEQLRKEELAGQYGGIGARVGMQRDKNGNTWLTISEPIFSGPAYRAGLRSNDQIVEVEGESTANKDLQELVSKLRGPAASKVKFKVYRRGWDKARDYEIAREEIQLETTMHRMLPGSIGYIRLATFGAQDIKGVKDAIEDLDRQGMKALVFDLRGNSGGYLRTAEKLADYFLDVEKVIVTTRARGEERERRVSQEAPMTKAPLIVLTDGQSASASEILAGALKVHERATLVGTRTFGKGSVQDLKMLKAADGKTALRVTIAKWYLPNGQTVETDDPKTPGGVEPNIVIELPERDFWKEAEFEKIRAGDELDTYLAENFKANKDLFVKLADSDGGDPARYPAFDKLYETVGCKASKEEFREVVREYVRKRVQDDQGKPLYFDFQADAVLQRGIIEACGKAGLDVKSIKEYDKFARAVEKK